MAFTPIPFPVLANTRPPRATSPDALLEGGGQMGERIRAFDWSRHPLGPVESWPRSLKIAIRIMLTSRYAMWLGWGEPLFFFCNDAYLPTVGLKRDRVLGAPTRQVWPEIWDAIGPRAESVVRTGNATWDESLLLFLERNGYAEETYHTFSYSPVPDDDGAIGGLLCVVTEETERVLNERRLGLLRELAADLAGNTTEEGLVAAITRQLARRGHDLPFALVYLFEASGERARLACAHGAAAGDRLAPAQLAGPGGAQTWPAEAIRAREPLVRVDDLAARFSALPRGPWDKPPRQALVVPIARQGSEVPAGFLVAGVNPYRQPDLAYEGFLKLLTGQIAAGLSNAGAYEAERRRAEALAELDRAKTAFFNNVSHELRTPLTLVLGPLDDLLHRTKDKFPPEGRELVQMAQRNALRLLKMVNTLLDFSRLEAGRMQPSIAPIDLAGLTTELAESFRPAIEKTGLRLILECPPLPEPVYVDREMWEKIVLNLLSNAFKFTHAGEIRVTLRLIGDCVEFAVQDTGEGIPPEAKPHLFERFYRVRGTKGRTFEGTGIGLALVHELVKLHGGNLHVESEPGTGSTFSVFLRRGRAHLPAGSEVDQPLGGTNSTTATAFVEEATQWADVAAPGPDRPALPAAPEAAEAAPIATALGKVLVADDSADMRSYIARLLEPRYTVIAVPDGSAAFQAVQLHRPDLVLSDVMMPKLDGFGLLQAIRSRPELRTIPVILLSARAGEESRVEGLDAGADDYLVKPFSARELLARINVHLHMARIRGQAEERERELRTHAEMFARALRDSSQRLSASLAAAGTGTFRWDVATNLIDGDEALGQLLAMPAGRGLRSLADLLQLVHPEDRTRVRESYERCAAVGADFGVEFRVPLRDGSVRWIDGKGKSFYDDAGKPVYMIGACVDVTKRKQTEAFVWRQKDVLEQIVRGAPLGDVLEALTLDVEQVAERHTIALVLMLDDSGARLRPVAGRRTPPGWTEHVDGLAIGPAAASCGVAAQRNERIIVPDIGHHPVWKTHRHEALKRGLRAATSTPIVSSSGKVLGTFDLYFAEPAVPTEHELKLIDIATRTAAIAVERDRSHEELRRSKAKLEDYAQTLERRVMERTARLQETVSELESFSYSISHDMRAPLRAMQSFAEILADECGERVGPEGRDYLRRIVSASHRMDRLIQDVLTYSRVTRTELALAPVDLQALVHGIIECYPDFQPPRAEIELVAPLPRVLGNEAALTQCFSNLIGNAVKFVAPGVVPRIRIWAEPHGPRLRVFVRDNGIGIEPSAHEKIFAIFYQLDRDYDGTGIGLSIVRKAVERMGGHAGVASELGQGSTFYLELHPAP